MISLATKILFLYFIYFRYFYVFCTKFSRANEILFLLNDSVPSIQLFIKISEIENIGALKLFFIFNSWV